MFVSLRHSALVCIAESIKRSVLFFLFNMLVVLKAFDGCFQNSISLSCRQQQQPRCSTVRSGGGWSRGRGIIVSYGHSTQCCMYLLLQKETQ